MQSIRRTNVLKSETNGEVQSLFALASQCLISTHRLPSSASNQGIISNFHLDAVLETLKLNQVCIFRISAQTKVNPVSSRLVLHRFPSKSLKTYSLCVNMEDPSIFPRLIFRLPLQYSPTLSPSSLRPLSRQFRSDFKRGPFLVNC